MSRLFGWSLPPGCTTLPGEEPEGPCGLCGKTDDECGCPECEMCGGIGCIEHISDGELLARFYAADTEKRRRESERTYPCGYCGKPVHVDLNWDGEVFCPDTNCAELDWAMEEAYAEDWERTPPSEG